MFLNKGAAMNYIKSRYIFGALIGVMLLTTGLFFFMNIPFIQKQLKVNIIQEIEFSREIYRLKLESINTDELQNAFDQLFIGDDRSSKIQVLIYDDYGTNIAGNMTLRDEGINEIKTVMLNGHEDTIYKDGIFYSFTHVKTNYGEAYLMLEMSDQKYIEGIRNYYFRTLLITFFVSVSILLMGFKLIDMQKMDIEINK